MKTNCNKKIIFVLTLCICSFLALSQNSYIKNRWNYKIGVASGPLFNISQKKSIQIRSEVNYGFFDLLEIGGYLGLSKYMKSSYAYTDTLGNVHNTSKNALAPFYGINANFHLLPLLINKDNFRFDLYVAGKAGGYYLVGTSSDRYHGHEWQFFLGGGAAFYAWKHLGFFTEFGYEKNNTYINNKKNNSAFRFGLTLKY